LDEGIDRYLRISWRD